MSRIVPARPRSLSAHQEKVLLELERSLSDEFIVFQHRPVEGYLVAHPDQGFCIVKIIEGEKVWDADAEAWSGIDLGQIEKSSKLDISSQLPDHAFSFSMLAVLPDTVRNAAPQDDRLIFKDEHQKVVAAVKSAMSSATDRTVNTGAGTIDALLQAISPGASSYQRGQVAEAQRAWRQERDGGKGGTGFTAPPQATPVAMVSVAQQGAPLTVMSDSDPLILLIRQAVESASKQVQLTLFDMPVSFPDLAAPDNLLPALLIAVSEDWAPIVASQNERAGFRVRLMTDKRATLGYSVAAIHPSAIFLLLLPIIDKLRKASAGDICVLDGMVSQFMRWIAMNGFNVEPFFEFDFRLAR